MRTPLYRYTEWVSFNPKTFISDFTKVKYQSNICCLFVSMQLLNLCPSQVYANELYLHDVDPLEDNNVAMNPKYRQLVKDLHEKLIAGWRHALPSYLNC